jgi:hypothetical protein
MNPLQKSNNKSNKKNQHFPSISVTSFQVALTIKKIDKKRKGNADGRVQLDPNNCEGHILPYIFSKSKCISVTAKNQD